VDKLTKWGYFIACIEVISIEDMAKTYIKEVFTRHGAPIKIILDRSKIYSGILGSILSRAKGLSSNINCILPIDR